MVCVHSHREGSSLVNVNLDCQVSHDSCHSFTGLFSKTEQNKSNNKEQQQKPTFIKHENKVTASLGEHETLRQTGKGVRA